MKIIQRFKLRSFILCAALLAGFGIAVPYASAQALIDLNSKTATMLDMDIPVALNDSGQVAGWSFTREGVAHAFITGPNGVGMTDLGTLGGDYSYASGINNAGQVVGGFVTREGIFHAFITGPDGLGMTDLGTLGGNPSLAFGINNAGQVVGYYFNMRDGVPHAFITGPDGVGMTDLGTLGGRESYAHGINDAGQVVGWSEMAEVDNVGQVYRHAFITGPDGVGMEDLNSLVDLPNNITLREALDINNAGQVLALSPIPPIPEPEIYAMLLGGLGLVGFMARRRKKRDARPLGRNPA